MEFNQGMYAKTRAKKNEPLSSLGKKAMRVVKKGVSVTQATPVLEAKRTASLATSVEEITPHQKKHHVADIGKEKADSCLSSVWDDAGLALTRAPFMADKLKVLSGMPYNEIVGRHIHKIIQVVYLCNFTFPFPFFCFSSESWVF